MGGVYIRCRSKGDRQYKGKRNKDKNNGPQNTTQIPVIKNKAT